MLNLEYIAGKIEKKEENIIFKLINRAQFKQNLKIYKKGMSGFVGHPRASLLDIRLQRQEALDARFGRFLAPQERPFNSNLPSSERAVSYDMQDLVMQNINVINLTKRVMDSHLLLMEKICLDGDDGQYGSSSEHDVQALQAISERIHFGAFYVAESKYQQNPEQYDELISQRDFEGMMQLLTRVEVEEKILARVREKVALYQQNTSERHFVPPEIISEYFGSVIIPLTKRGEIEYLMQRNAR